LTQNERSELNEITKDGKTFSKKFLHSRALLLCDASDGRTPWTVASIAEALGVTSRTIEHLKERFVEDGLEVAIGRKQRETPPREVIYDGAFEARLVQLACSEVPKGFKRWTVRLLSEKVVELKIAPSCSAMAVSRTLKKTNYSLIGVNTGKSHQMRTQHS
jgi:hypothetical protein